MRILFALLDINTVSYFHDKEETEKAYTTEKHTNNFILCSFVWPPLVQLIKKQYAGD